MTFISSNISITNRIEEAALYCYNGRLSEHAQILKPVLQLIEQQIFSRIIGSFIAPAAVLEIAIHVIILPFSIIYAIGRFAAIEVLHHKFGNNNFDDACREVKAQATRRYYMYASDFYPFGRTREVLEEIDTIFHRKI